MKLATDGTVLGMFVALAPCVPVGVQLIIVGLLLLALLTALYFYLNRRP